mmetsp:Transcript_27410/g.64021  ORF Transcript_27410/g.64021 Transcript_27410/m.64021 type:complete len:235 (-) Transcript_27410:635-1339(-)
MSDGMPWGGSSSRARMRLNRKTTQNMGALRIGVLIASAICSNSPSEAKFRPNHSFRCTRKYGIAITTVQIIAGDVCLACGKVAMPSMTPKMPPYNAMMLSSCKPQKTHFAASTSSRNCTRCSVGWASGTSPVVATMSSPSSASGSSGSGSAGVTSALQDRSVAVGDPGDRGEDILDVPPWDGAACVGSGLETSVILYSASAAPLFIVKPGKTKTTTSCSNMPKLAINMEALAQG